MVIDDIAQSISHRIIKQHALSGIIRSGLRININLNRAEMFDIARRRRVHGVLHSKFIVDLKVIAVDIESSDTLRVIHQSIIDNHGAVIPIEPDLESIGNHRVHDYRRSAHRPKHDGI